MKKPHVQSNARVGDLNIMQNWINSKLSMRGVYCICVCGQHIRNNFSVQTNKAVYNLHTIGTTREVKGVFTSVSFRTVVWFG